jgi:hypothetical protein
MIMDFNAALQEENAELLPAVSQPMTLEAVKPTFAEYVAAADQIVSGAAKIEVKDQKGKELAVSIGGNVKKIFNKIEAQRKKVTEDERNFVSSVNGYCKMITDKLTAAEVSLKKKISDYDLQQRIELQKREAAAAKAARELQAKLDKEAAEANAKAKADNPEAKVIVAPQVPEPIVPKESKITRTETGTSSYQRKVWKAEVTDDSLVPREYCSPDIKKINDAVKMGTREIPGVRIWEESTTVFRT